MKCGSFGFRNPSPHKAASGEMVGANLAEFNLARAMLTHSASIMWEIWEDNLSPSLTSTSGSSTIKLDQIELKREFGCRVQENDLATSSTATLHDTDYVFISNARTFSRISELRSHLNASGMPICVLTHSLYTEDMLSRYGWLLMSSQAHDVIVASSEAGKQTLENLFAASGDHIGSCLGVSPTTLRAPRIVQIPFGTDVPSHPEVETEQARLLLKIPMDAFVILYFGRITEEYKGDLDPLLQAVSHLADRGKNVWLILAGQALDRVYSQHLERRMSALSLSERSIYLANCPEFLKTIVYAACSVMVSPVDSVQETFGLAILEAMAHRRPVIASDWSGYRELVEDGKTGFLIRTIWTPEASQAASIMKETAPSPIATAHYLAQRTIVDCGELIEKLAILAENPELRMSMGNAGWARVQSHYTWVHVAGQFLALWEDQLERSQKVALSRRFPSLDAFNHYATDILSPHDLLARIPGSDIADIGILKQWIFCDQNVLAEVRRLFELTANTPVSIGELRQEGFKLDSILWLAKKGLRRIVRLHREK